MQLTKEQESSILISHQEAITTAIKKAVEHELNVIKSDWKMQDQVRELIRTQFGCMVNEVIANKLKDRKLVEELVSEKLAASSQEPFDETIASVRGARTLNPE